MTESLAVPNTPLSDGTTIPQLGYGVWRVADDVAQTAVGEALDAGYRMVDTAALYRNEVGVGRALAAAADRGISTDDVYLTTKLSFADLGYDNALRAYDASTERLGIEKIDLYLIHWPVPARGELYVDSWKALVRLQEEGRVTSIGVCNFGADHLDRIIAETGVRPVLNQIELHPYLQQRELQAANRAHGIVTQDWSPLGAGDNNLLADPVLTEIAGRHGVTAAQVVLAWHLAQGNVVIPKSVTPSRIAENLAAVEVTLSAQDLALIDGLDKGERTGPDPAVFDPQ